MGTRTRSAFGGLKPFKRGQLARRRERQPHTQAPADTDVTGPLTLGRHPKAQPVARPGEDPRLDEGLRLYNEGHDWHAHEVWDPLWMGLEGDDKLFLKGLIMSAAMLHQHQR